MTEQTIRINYKNWELDVSYAHKLRGGTTIVCLHGIQANRRMFTPLEDFFERRKFSSLAIDFIGFGRSPKPEDFTYDLRDQAAIVDLIIHEMKLQKFSIVGHGMGGMVGTLLLDAWRSSLLGFVNMEGLEENSDHAYPELLTSLDTSTEPSAKLRRQWLRLTPEYAYAKTSASIAEWSRNGKLVQLFTESPVPKVFVHGERNPDAKRILLPHVPTSTIAGAGHFMLEDNLTDCTRVIDDYLS